MNSWPDRRLLDLFGIEMPIIQAPMAGPGTPELAMAVSDAGGLGSLPCAQLSVEQTRAALELIGPCASRPLNLNFFCHTPPAVDAVRSLTWRARLAPYYVELGLDPEAPLPVAGRRPFDDDFRAGRTTHSPARARGPGKAVAQSPIGGTSDLT